VCVVKLIQNKFYLVKLYEEDDILTMNLHSKNYHHHFIHKETEVYRI